MDDTMNRMMRRGAGYDTPAQPAGSAPMQGTDPGRSAFLDTLRELNAPALDPDFLYEVAKDRGEIVIGQDGAVGDLREVVRTLWRNYGSTQFARPYRPGNVDGGAGYGDPPAQPSVNMNEAIRAAYRARRAP